MGIPGNEAAGMAAKVVHATIRLHNPEIRADFVIWCAGIGHTRVTHFYMVWGEPQLECELFHATLTVRPILIESPGYTQEPSLYYSQTFMKARFLQNP